MKTEKTMTIYELAAATGRKVKRLFTQKQTEGLYCNLTAMVELKEKTGRKTMTVSAAMEMMTGELT